MKKMKRIEKMEQIENDQKKTGGSFLKKALHLKGF
jgi:hypothetical protein